VVQIRSKRLAAIHYAVLLIILAYVVGWAIVYKKGYQSIGDLVGNNSLKVKGNAYHIDSTTGNLTIWDSQDVVYPPKEPEALFVTTNFHETLEQSRQICTGSDESEKCPCTPYDSTLNGINTGTCNQTAGYCQLYAWCPLENEGPTVKNNTLAGIQQFSIFVRSTVRFPKWNGIMANNANGTTTTKNYNLFLVGDMIEATGYKYEDFSMLGGAIAVVVHWDCNLDRDIQYCQPNFSFVRVDDPKKDTFSKGYNFRYANYYYLPDPNNPNQFSEHRDLFKVYGIRFIFLLTGQGGKFDIVPLIINIGSGLALLTVATLLSDMITLYILPERKFYNTVKYEMFDDPHATNKKKKFTELKREGEADFEAAEDNGAKPAEDSPLLDSVKFR
jgi:hypothetical protein